MHTSTVQPDPRIAAYIAEVSQPGVPWISTSHITLWRLQREHGAPVVDKLMKDYFEALRPQ